jgi:DNA-binding response OmpR family regulator
MTHQVLIVEDTEDIANFVLLALQQIGLEAHHANSADKALKYLETTTPDLIILDIGLPGMSGWQLLDTIQGLREQNRILVVVTTAFADPANRVVGKLQHVDAYLSKPFSLEELKTIVQQQLQKRA